MTRTGPTALLACRAATDSGTLRGACGMVGEGGGGFLEASKIAVFLLVPLYIHTRGVPFVIQVTFPPPCH